MSGPKFFQTNMGSKFYEGTMPELVKQLERIADALNKGKPPPIVPKGEISQILQDLRCGRTPRFDEEHENQANTPKSPWRGDVIQFAQLLCEIRTHCELEGFDQVMESMDLDDEQMDELWERVDATWEKYKEPLNVPPKSDLTETIKVSCSNCAWIGWLEDMSGTYPTIEKLWERIEPGEEVPAGTCPQCYGLVHLLNPDKILAHMNHLNKLEVATYYDTKEPYYDTKEPGNISSVTVECTQCNEVIHELFSADRIENEEV